MKVLVSTTAGTGHFEPLLPFARACAVAGHEVRVAAPRSFAGTVTRSGFDHLPFDDAPPDQLGMVFESLRTMSFDEANEVVIREVFGRLDTGAALPGVEHAIRAWQPDIVLRETAEVASYVAAEAAGVPHVQVDVSLSSFGDYTALFEDPLVELGAQPGLQGLRAAPRLSLIPQSLDGSQAPGSPSVGRFRDVVSPSGAELPDWWSGSEEPLVYVTFGTVTAGLADFGELYRAVLDVLAGVPVRVLLTTGEAFDVEVLGAIPSSVHVERYWPQRDVMPHAAAMIAHGGLGTTLLGLSSGVPMVLLPLFADQPHNADRVAELGAAIVLHGGLATVGELPEALERLLAEEVFRTRAGGVADEISRLPLVAHAVPALEELVSP